MKDKRTSILMIVQYPENVSPGQRFRFELYKDMLIANGFTVTTKSFLNQKGYNVIHKFGYLFAKSFAILRGFLERLCLTFVVKKYDFILLQREVTPIGPPLFEWIYIKLCKSKVIYDFDDAIWIPYVSKQNNLAAILKNTGKVKSICKWAYKVSCGNQYLCNYARRYNANVVYNPTCVDTDNSHNKLTDHDAEKITIGWTGSFSTMMYLDIVIPALGRLQEKYDFAVKIISNQQLPFHLKNVQYVEWNELNEVQELSTCQIGLMPLSNDEWSEGKCGFKLIQYFALEIPAVASPVGVNKIILQEGVNGYFANSETEWYTAIEKLILDPALRKKMGKAGREKIIDQYSLRSNYENFIGLFK